MPAKKATPKKTTVRARARAPGSLADQINNLEEGQSVSQAERFEIDGVDAGGLLESLKKMRSNLGAYVARITDEIDMREFRVEGGEFVTNDKTAIIVTVVVTRVA